MAKSPELGKPIRVGGSGRASVAAAAPQPFHTACPLCRERVEVTVDPEVLSVTCPACSFHFELARPAPPASHPGNGSTREKPQPLDPLDRWLAGQPVHSRELTDVQRLRQWCRRRPYHAAAMAAAALVVSAAALLATVGYLYVCGQAGDLDRQRQRAEQLRADAESTASAQVRLANARRDAAERDLAARRTTEQGWKETEGARWQAELQRVRAEQEQALASAQREARVALARQLVDDARLCADTEPPRSLLLATGALLAERGQNRDADRASEQVLRDALAQVDPQVLPGHQAAIQAMAVSPTTPWLITGGSDRTARLWNLSAENPAGSAIVLGGHRDLVSSVAISPDGRWAATGSYDATAMLWNLTAEDPSANPIVLRGHKGWIRTLAFGPDSGLLLTAGGQTEADDCAARLWNLAAADPTQSPMLLRGHERPILAAAISPDGHWAITASEDETIRLWNLQARFPAAEQVVLSGHEGWIGSLTVSPDSHWLATASHDGTARLWNLQAADPSLASIVLRGHQRALSTLAISPDGRWLATGSFDRTACLWDLTAEDPAAKPLVFEGHATIVRALAFSPKSRWLATGSVDGIVRLWDLAAEDPAAVSIVLRGQTGPINTLAVTSDSRWLLAGGGESREGQDHAVRVWDVELETLLQSARLAAARHLSLAQRRSILLESAQRDGSQQSDAQRE